MLGNLLSKNKGNTGLNVQVRERNFMISVPRAERKNHRLRQKTVTREKQQEA